MHLSCLTGCDMLQAGEHSMPPSPLHSLVHSPLRDDDQDGFPSFAELQAFAAAAAAGKSEGSSRRQSAAGERRGPGINVSPVRRSRPPARAATCLTTALMTA